jgi:hypothetical protein
LTEQGQSSNFPGNQAIEPLSLDNRREWQLSENTNAVWYGVCHYPLGQMGLPAVVSAGSDDPPVTQAAVEHLRRERPFGLSHVFEGGGASSQVGTIEEPKCERPTRPSHVVDGGDAQQVKGCQQVVNHWSIRLETPQMESPAVIRKRELMKQLEDLEHYLTLDGRFFGLLFEIKSTRPGRQRNKILDLFWTDL